MLLSFKLALFKAIFNAAQSTNISTPFLSKSEDFHSKHNGKFLVLKHFTVKKKKKGAGISPSDRSKPQKYISRLQKIYSKKEHGFANLKIRFQVSSLLVTHLGNQDCPTIKFFTSMEK